MDYGAEPAADEAAPAAPPADLPDTAAKERYAVVSGGGSSSSCTCHITCLAGQMQPPTNASSIRLLQPL